MNAIRRERVKPGIWRRRAAEGGLRYEITFRDSDGRQRRQVVNGGVRAAEAALADAKARMGRGERVAPAPRLTFADAAERWQGAQVARLRPSTQESYAWALRKHLLPAWGGRRLDALTVDDVARLVEDMRRAGYAAWSIRGCLTVAGRVFDFAARRLGWAGRNPVRLLDRGERPRHEQRDRRILTSEELAALLAAADDEYRALLTTAAGLGTRLGETLGLRWHDVDPAGGTVAVRHQVDRRGDLVPLKTARSRRVIEAPGSVVAALRAHKLASHYSGPDDFVFASRAGGPLEALRAAASNWCE